MDWSTIPLGSEDAIYRVSRLYAECTDPHKVNLGVGAYRDEDGKPLVLDAVIRARSQLAVLPPQEWTHEYQTIRGHDGFLLAAQELAFGRELKDGLGGRLVSLQTISGTGACRLGFEFMSTFVPTNTEASIMLPRPTWANHKLIAKFAKLKVLEYRYLDSSNPEAPSLDINGMIEDMRMAPKGTAVLLQLCAHNPTGVDPTLEQWSRIADVVKERDLQPFFDNAYQGFATGDLEGDASALRTFVKKGLCPLVACSFAKNMGLYGERVGALHLVAPDPHSARAALSQLKVQARALHSNPPRFGAEVAYRVMSQPDLRRSWEAELRRMSGRIRDARAALRSRLEELTKKGNWAHVTNQIGMFSYTGLTKNQVRWCAENGSVFMLDTGRISMAGVNGGNVDQVAQVMAEAIEACPPPVPTPTLMSCPPPDQTLSPMSL